MAERSLRQLLAAAGVAGQISPPSANPLITHITADSRKVRRGGLFVAVCGTKVDGNTFINAVRESGASAVVVERDSDGPDDMACVRVDHAGEAVSKLSAAFFGLRGPGSDPPRLIGVTGTNGKSTVALLVQAILRAAGHPTALLGTIYYDLVGERVPAPWTTPPAVELSDYLRRAVMAGATHAALEVSSHALDQRRCDGLCFDAAIFTNLTGDHLDYHQTRDHYAASKARLFAGLVSTATAVVNGEDPASDEMVAACKARVVRYGIEGKDLDARATVRTATARGTVFEIEWPGADRVHVNSRLVGRHNVMNMLGAATAARAVGVPEEAVVSGLESVVGVPGRLQRVEPEGHPFAVFVDYAHSDDSLTRVLETLRPLTSGRLICVFGCGGNRDRTKRPRMGAAVSRSAHLAVLTSDNPRWETPRDIMEEARAGFSSDNCLLHLEVDRQAAIRWALTEARMGDTVLIAGKGHEDYQEIRGERLPFDDAQIAIQFIKEGEYDPVGIG